MLIVSVDVNIDYYINIDDDDDCDNEKVSGGPCYKNSML